MNCAKMLQREELKWGELRAPLDALKNPLRKKRIFMMFCAKAQMMSANANDVCLAANDAMLRINF